MITNSEHSNVQQQHQQIPISPSGCLFVALIGAVDTGKTSLLNCISESKNNYYNNYSSSIPYWSLLSNAVTSSNSHEYLRSVIFSHHDDIDPQQKEWHYIRFLDKQHRKVRNDSIYAQLMNTTMDGMILVVDCVEGYHSNLDYVLGEQLFSKTNGRKMKPLLFINKIDRLIRELALQPEECYRLFLRIIDHANASMLTKFADQLEPEWEFDPLLENVAFGSTMFDFAFTLNDFASLFAPKFHVPKHKVISKLWGDKFFDAETQRWTQTPLSQSGKACKHGFTHFVMTPIFTLFRLIQDRHIYPSDRLEKALQRIDIQLSQEEALLESKSLTTLVMRKFLPISRALMNMITTHVTFKPKNSRKFMFHNLRNETTKLQQLSDINIVTLRNSER